MDTGQTVPTLELEKLVRWMRDRGVRRVVVSGIELELGDEPVERIPLDFADESVAPEERDRRRKEKLCVECGEQPAGGLLPGHCRFCSLKAAHGHA